MFRTLRLDIDLVAKQIDNIERIKFAVSFYVARPDEVSLVNVVDAKRLGKIGVFNTLGYVRSFF